MIFTLQLLSSLRMKGHAQTAISAALAILGWTAIYYATSIGSTVWNARLVDGGHVSVTVLTLLHLLVSLSSDIAIMHYGTGEGAPKLASDSRRHSIWEIARAFLPISLFVVMSKLTTYLSYRTVSVGLSHTAKASEPLFNVLVARAVFGERRSPVVYLSLVPIALGVTLASLTDFSYNTTGFLWAVASALLKVLQNIFVKRVMQSGRFTFMEVHFYCGVAALLVLMPVMLLQAATASSNPFAHFPLLALLACSLLQYGSSLASYRVLHLTAHLTATIINVMKRLLTIVLATLAADAPMSPLNATGVILAGAWAAATGPAYAVTKHFRDSSAAFAALSCCFICPRALAVSARQLLSFCRFLLLFNFRCILYFLLSLCSGGHHVLPGAQGRCSNLRARAAAQLAVVAAVVVLGGLAVQPLAF